MSPEPKASEEASKHQESVEAKQKQERERSTIEFPYLSLDVAIEIAKGVHATGGTQSRLDQVAAHLGESANGGAFRNKLVTSKIFGLTTHSGNTITLSSLGAKIVDPDQERVGRAEAFLTVPLYKAIYEKFLNGTLPPQQGLESAMVTLGVAAKQKERARQSFQRSAKEAGFFAYGSTRLVYPTVPTAINKPTEERDEVKDGGNSGTASGGNVGSEGKKRHPFIEGLLETLPPAALGSDKTVWSLKDREDWLQTAAGIFNLIYKLGEGDSGAISVTWATPQKSSPN